MSIEKIVHQVQTMHSQGLNNNQIIQSLQRSGYSSSEIFEALNQVSQGVSSPAVSQPEDNSGSSFPTPAHHESADNNEHPAPPASAPAAPPAAPPHPSSYPSPGAPPPPPNNFPSTTTENIEEMVEAVIDEKWNELVKDITTIIEWKNNAQNTIVTLEQQFVDLKEQFNNLHHALIGKISGYDKNILDVGAEVKAMEKVFSKVLPIFTDNVAQLTKISKDMKKK